MIESACDPTGQAIRAAGRRRILGLLAGSALGGVLGAFGFQSSDADDQRTKKQRRRKRRRNRRHQRGGSGGGGAARYPDLKTMEPSDLCFGQVNGVWVLRFGNVVWNDGEGPLELQGNPDPDTGESTDLYQNLYDAPIGGRRTTHRKLDGRIVYHPTHEHYHFADFASYVLLKKVGEEYTPISEGTKTGFCIIDNYAMAEDPYPPQFTRCDDSKRQGLTPGWVDEYAWDLADQWVVVGPDPLPAGEYGLRSTADPRGLLDEGGDEREANNGAITYFRAEDIPTCRGFFDLP